VRRLVSPFLFLAVAASFLLPFLTVTAVGRRATASGVQLVTAEASFSGTYSHAAYEGDVETVVRNARAPAIVFLAAAFVGVAATALPGRNAMRVGFAAAIVAVLAYLALLQVTSPRFSPPHGDHLAGFWLAGFLAAGALAWTALRLWRDPPAEVAHGGRADVPSWLR
jgi:hypothetical protein